MMSKKLFLVMALFCAALLIGPRISDEDADKICLRNFHFNSFLGFSLNCDSPGFIVAAISPGMLLEEGNIRQSRPGLIYVAHLISMPMTKIMALFKGRDADRLHGPEHPLYMKTVFFDWFPVYMTYEIFNLVFLSLALILYLRILTPLAPAAKTVPAIGLLLIFNDVVKAYFWSPHTQMFNILLPVFCIWVFVGVLRHGWFDTWKLQAAAAAAGLGVLAYPSFALFLPAALAPLPWAGSRGSWSGWMVRIPAIVVLCLGPSLAWWAYVMATVGSYYQHEVVQYKQVVWMFEAARQGLPVLVSALAEKARLMLGHTLVQGAPALTMLAVSVLVAWAAGPAPTATAPGMAPAASGPSPKPAAAEVWSIVAGAVVTLVLVLAFVTAVGMNLPRLAYMMVVSLIVLAGLAAGLAEQRLTGGSLLAFRVLVIAAVVEVGVIEVWKDGPLGG